MSRTWFKHVENEAGQVVHGGEGLMFALSLLMIPAIFFEASTSSVLHKAAEGLFLAIWLGFALELVYIAAYASNRMRTLRAHWIDVAIVLLSLPLLPGLATASAAMRVFRLVLAGVRAMAAARKVFSPTGLRYATVGVLFLVTVSGSALSEVDHKDVHSLQDGIWWAIVTVTTVGYGDIVPHTLTGRIIAGIVMIVGIGFFAILTAAVSATFVKQDERPDLLQQQVEAIDARLERLETVLARIEAQVSGKPAASGGP